MAEVGRDALEEPPNFSALSRALSIVDEPVVAAGGVRNLEDLAHLRDLEVDGKHIGGVVVGREVTAGRFTIEEALGLLDGDAVTVTGPWEKAELEKAAEKFGESEGEDKASTALEFIEWLATGGADSG